uniref:Uncharacterized protein n=1 Tax=Phlebotomus papatasi TaxID=29031 RepID=A0A1B0DDD0_PHLPP
MDSFGSIWPSPPRGLDGVSNDGLPMETLTELQDGNFEPQTRARSNTWPLPRPDNIVEPSDDTESNKCSNQQLSGDRIRPTKNDDLFNSSTLVPDMAKTCVLIHIKYGNEFLRSLNANAIRE